MLARTQMPSKLSDVNCVDEMFGLGTISGSGKSCFEYVRILMSHNICPGNGISYAPQKRNLPTTHAVSQDLF